MITYNLNFSKELIHKTFWTSDLHYDHDRKFIWGAPGRDYKSVKQMNDDIVHSWNSTCDDKSIVFHLGDLMFGDPNGMKALDLYSRLNFKKLYCLWGNHHSGERTIYQELMKERGYENKELYPLSLDLDENKRVVFLGHYADMKIGPQRIILAHYPMDSWNSSFHGSWMLHGHCHCNLKNDKNLKRLDVGWDQMKKPLSFIDINNKMKNLTQVSSEEENT